MIQTQLINFIAHHQDVLNISDIQTAIECNAQAAVTEDLGSGDITSTLIAEHAQAEATLITREPAILCGIPWVESVCNFIDPNIQIEWQASDGNHLIANQCIAQFFGCARSLLTAERTLLNFLQTLSATATTTHHYVHLLKGYRTELLDTRKTVPGLRIAQKYAVYCGGGKNHRLGLFDAFLIKENHIAAAGSIAAAVKKARALYPKHNIEVEVETQIELEQAMELNVDRILCDNFSIEALESAVERVNGKIPLEASGGIDEHSLRKIAKTGVDFVSMGGLTKHITAIDLSLRLSIY